MNEVSVFNSTEFGRIRMVTVNGDPWFFGKDAVQRHVDAEDTVLNGVEIPDPMGRIQI